MNPELRDFIDDLINNIESKNSWGKIELKDLILNTLTKGKIEEWK